MSSIHVTGTTASEDSLRKFFSFCGKITSIKKDSSTSTITFEKPAAVKTALSLDGAQVDGDTIKVTADDADLAAASSAPAPKATEDELTHDHDELKQEDKPRSAIAAEYLAHGYVLGDVAVKRLVDTDQKMGISARFQKWFEALDAKFHLTSQAKNAQASISQQAKNVDERNNVSGHATNLFSVSKGYLEKALATPQGQQVRTYYSKGAQTIADVHAEAVRLAEQKKGTSTTGTAAGTGTAEIADGASAATTTSSVPTSAGHETTSGAKTDKDTEKVAPAPLV